MIEIFLSLIIIRYLSVRAQTRQEKPAQILKNFNCQEGIKLSKIELYILMNFCLTVTCAFYLSNMKKTEGKTHIERQRVVNCRSVQEYM